MTNSAEMTPTYTHKIYAVGSCMFEGENGGMINVHEITEDGGEMELEIGSCCEVTQKDVDHAFKVMRAAKKSAEKLLQRSMRRT